MCVVLKRASWVALFFLSLPLAIREQSCQTMKFSFIIFYYSCRKCTFFHLKLSSLCYHYTLKSLHSLAFKYVWGKVPLANTKQIRANSTYRFCY